MRLKVNNYLMESIKINKDTTILNITDVHSNIKALKLIGKYIDTINIDYIVMVGDILDRHNLKNEDEFIDELINLSKKKELIISLGNHELYKYKQKKDLTKKDILNSNYYKRLSKSKNIIMTLEDIKTITNKDIDITLLNMPDDYYDKKEDINIFKEYMDKLDKENKLDSKKFNILLSHTPNPFIKKKKIINDYNLINNCDLILCGHNHAGLMPTFIQDIFNNHIGLLGPFNEILSKNAYGYWVNDNKTLLVSNGVTKLSNTSKIHFIRNFISNTLYSVEIDLIQIKKANKNNFKLVNRKRVK